MAVETSTTISGLNAAWPLGSDLRSEGDNHLRLIKGTLQSCFDDSGTTLKTTKPIETPGGKLSGNLDANGNQITNVAAVWQRGLLFGLVMANNVSDVVNDIDVAAGSAASDDAVPWMITLPGVMTKRTDAAWAAGSGNGGFDGGAMPGNITGHVFLIGKSTDPAAADIFISNNLAPTLPSGWDRKRRIGSILKDATPALRPFRQYGNRFVLTTALNVRNSAAAVTDTLLGMQCPGGLRLRMIIRQDMSMSASSAATVNMYDGDAAAGATPNHLVQNVNSSGSDTTIVDHVYTNTSAQIRFTLGISAGTVASCATFLVGWWDDRGIIG